MITRMCSMGSIVIGRDSVIPSLALRDSKQLQQTKDRARACEDILWAVLNTLEVIQRR